MDIRFKPRSYIRSTDIRTDIRLDIGFTNFRAWILLWISVVVRIIRHGHPYFTDIQADIRTESSTRDRREGKCVFRPHVRRISANATHNGSRQIRDNGPLSCCKRTPTDNEWLSAPFSSSRFTKGLNTKTTKHRRFEFRFLKFTSSFTGNTHQFPKKKKRRTFLNFVGRLRRKTLEDS